jgi:hypothetical protein
MTTHADTEVLWVKPVLGMTLAFTPTSEVALADIPAKVVYIWPRFRSGDYLVTLEYTQSVKFGNEFIHHIDAFMSELYEPTPATNTHPTPRVPRGRDWLAQYSTAVSHIARRVVEQTVT